MPDFYTVVTDIGLQALGLATTQGQSFSLTHAVVGDGNGGAVVPNKGMTNLVNEVWRGNVAGIKVDPEDPNTLIFEFAIPADTGGFTIREVGLLDERGKLFCIGNFPDTEKPVAADGSVRDLVVRLPLHFENADQVTVVIDAAVALATQQDLNDHNEDPEAHQRATEIVYGFGRFGTVEEHKAKTANNVACNPIGVWEMFKSVMSSAYTSTSMLTVATSKAVSSVYTKLTEHTGATAVHVPVGGNVGEVLTKTQGGKAWLTADGGTQSVNIVTFTSSGTYNKPSNLVFAEVYVTGGGSAGSAGNTVGGSAGGTAIKTFISSELASSELVVIGAGGVANGGKGGASSFKEMIGLGGGWNGYGGSASGGDINLIGSGGGGAARGGTYNDGGAGGSSFWGGGGAATQGNVPFKGFNGSGGGSRGESGGTGGNGGDGIVVIKEFLRKA